MKIDYTSPTVTIMMVSLKSRLLDASQQPSGAQTQGFSSAGTYTDSDWDIL